MPSRSIPHTIARSAAALAVVVAGSCATGPAPVLKTAPVAESGSRCWAGQMTEIDDEGYGISSMPMLLRVERDAQQKRIVRELALGRPASVQRDVLFIGKDGGLQFVESDAGGGYEVVGQLTGDPWAGGKLDLELKVTGQSVRVEEWGDGPILYGRYRYKDADGTWGRQRFHALSQISGDACQVRFERARKGTIEATPDRSELGASPQPEPATAKLTYQWPQNLDATVFVKIHRTGAFPSEQPSIEAAYQLRTTPENEGDRIELRSRELLALPKARTLEDEDRWDRARVLVSMFPAVVIDPAGGVAQLAEPVGYLETVRKAFVERWGHMLELDDAAMKEFLDEIITEELALRSAARYWNPLVAFWAGSDVTIGAHENVVLTRAIEIPGVEQPVEVTVPTSFGAEGWVPCTAEETEPRCIKLVSQHAVDEYALRGALTHAGPDGRPVRVERHTDMTQTVLITDPQTLMPYHYFEERFIDSVMGNAYDRKVIQRREAIELRFSY